LKNPFSALNKYFADTDFWFDLIVLFLLWMAVFIIPEEKAILNIKLRDILKIIALISSLEAFGFFMNILMGRKKSLLMQGLFGGLISSTMTFLRLTTNTKHTQTPKTISQALILATIAMLAEGVLIVLTIHPSGFLLIGPFLIQITILILSVFLLKSDRLATEQLKQENLNLDEPIIWRKVLYFSGFIIGLIFVQRLINEFIPSYYIWTSFFVSLFEAHAVLAAAMTEIKPMNEIHKASVIILAILSGNVISKSFFIFRSRNWMIIKSVLIPLYLSLMAAILFYCLN
jgi:uncharacterized membrane protein (DUF4010 family)